MMALRADLKVVVASQPIDFRRGVNGLVALVAEALGADPYCGQVFVFRSKRGQHQTFNIQFATRDDRISLASAVR